MNDLRQAIIDSLDSCATDNTDIRETVQNLVENEGFVEIDITEGNETAQTLAKNLGIPINSPNQKKNPEN